jgi:hypothetical protein
MRSTAPPPREHRTITVDILQETTSFPMLGDGQAFLPCVMAFVMAIGFELKHKASSCGGWRLARHSPSVRVRLAGVPLWCIQCTTCTAVFTVLPHFV